MPIHHLEKIFKPRSIAVVGASDRPGSVGNSVLQNLIRAGFPGAIYPVNPKHHFVQGLPAYAELDRIPQRPDLAIICTPAVTVPTLVEQCGKAGVNGLLVLSAGFREIGEEGKKLELEVQAALRRFPDLRMIGPNCLGVISPHQRLNASFSAGMPQPGKVALLSQSGALCTAILDWAREEGIGFSHFISVGNMLDVDLADLIDYFNGDPQTKSIVLYAESVPHARRFLSAARAFTRDKPIVAYKSGRFADSARAAMSHSGALAGEDAVYDAAFQRAGIVRVLEIDDLFDTAELLARCETPRGSRLAIVTNAGGPGVIAVDALISRGGTLATLSSQTLDRLNLCLPSCWSHGNPIDVLGDADATRFVDGSRLALADENVDGLLAILTPQAMTDPTAIARALAELKISQPKPVLASWMGGRSIEEGEALLNSAGIPTYRTPEHAIKAYMSLVELGKNRDLLAETPRDLVHATNEAGKAAAARHNHVKMMWEGFRELPAVGQDAGDATPSAHPDAERILLSEEQAKQLLREYGIRTTYIRSAYNQREAVNAARQLGYPVVLKVLSPQITHKSDVGGVQLNLRTDSEVERAYDAILSAAAERVPGATIEGVTVQPMISPAQGTELILGAKRDATFGSVVLVGMGGITAECLRDRSIGLPPLNERLALRMLKDLRTWPLLNGFRGRAPVDLDRLCETIIRFSYMIAECPEVLEFDVNPLLASPQGVMALDARGVVQRAGMSPAEAYAHLAIRPYPQELIQEVTLDNGQRVLLRPIQAEDEPLWTEMLDACSPETIRTRFRCLLKHPTHDFASRFCLIDYDRELGLVAEVQDGDRRRLVGVGRLVADPDHRTAEFAVLVADHWQNHRLGTLLTKSCVALAREWGLRSVTAETDWTNKRMLSAFQECGFYVEGRIDGVVRVRQDL